MHEQKNEVIYLDSVTDINSDLKGPVEEKTVCLEQFANEAMFCTASKIDGNEIVVS